MAKALTVPETEAYRSSAYNRDTLSGATFAMTPDGLTSAPFYTDAMPAKRRARAWYKHDPAGRLLEIKHFWDQIGTGLPNYNDYTANIPLLGASYTYETSTSGGNANRGLKLTADFTKNVSGSFTTEKKQDYQYHAALDYLTQARYDDDANASWDATHTWTYDAAGNRATENGGSTWTYDELNRILTSPSVTYGHDILGQRTSQTGSKTFTWDLVGRMTAHNNGNDTFNYRYRADGMRITKKKNAGGYADARFFYDGQMLCEEYFYGNTYPRDYVQTIRYGLGARGIDYIERDRTESDTLVGFPIYDGHGNMVATLSRAASDSYTLGDQRHFDAWGRVRAGNTTGEPNPRYVANLGHVQDDESGFVYMRARYYEPGSGRFICQDLAREGTNWYIYCWNNPIGKIDESGNDANNLVDWALIIATMRSWCVALKRAMNVCFEATAMGIVGITFLMAWIGVGHGALSDGNASGYLKGSGIHLAASLVFVLEATLIGALLDGTSAYGNASPTAKCVATATAYALILSMFLGIENALN